MSQGSDPIELSYDERLLEGAMEAAISALQTLAATWRDEDSDDERTDAAAEAFDGAIELAAARLNDINFAALLGRDNPVSLALMALAAERVALGLAPEMEDQDGHAVDLDDPDEFASFEEFLEQVYDLEGLELLERLERFRDDPAAAALEVGVHLARDGFNDPFALPAWSSPCLHLCVAAAAVTSATLARLVVNLDLPANPVSLGVGPAALTALTQAACLVYRTLDAQDIAALTGGHGTYAEVVADILYEADYLEDLDGTDCYRLSGLLLPAFAAGYAGAKLASNLEAEDALQARALLAAAYETGQAAASPERTVSMKSLSMLPLSSQAARRN